MNLPELILWAFGALAVQRGGEPEADRLAPVASAIAATSESAPLFAGAAGAGEAATGLLLAAIARHESDTFESVRRCKRRGDEGRSIGLYQVIRGPGWQGYSQEETCASDDLQARLAHGVLQLHRDRCASCGVTYLLRAYASGDGGLDTKAARDTEATYERMTRKAGLVVSGATARWQ